MNNLSIKDAFSELGFADELDYFGVRGKSVEEKIMYYVNQSGEKGIHIGIIFNRVKRNNRPEVLRAIKRLESEGKIKLTPTEFQPKRLTIILHAV